MANWGFSTEKDFEVADGWEQVILYRQDAAGEYAVVPSTADDESGRALREVPKRKQVAFGESVDVIWHLDATNWPSMDRLSTGDVILQVDTGLAWVIQTSDKAHVDDAWICQCIKFVGIFEA